MATTSVSMHIRLKSNQQKLSFRYTKLTQQSERKKLSERQLRGPYRQKKIFIIPSVLMKSCTHM